MRLALGIRCVVLVANEVDATLDLGGLGTEESRVGNPVGFPGRCCECVGSARTTEIGMGVVDPGVQHGNLDVLASVSDVLPHLVSFQEGYRGVIRRSDLVAGRAVDRDNFGEGFDLLELVTTHSCVHPVVGRCHLTDDVSAG